MREDCQIEIKNAFENNLKNININIPLNKFICVTGPSGCGKSSLIYDTLYAESQRDFLESMSGNMYGQKLMDKPKVGEIHNLRPALNVAQNYYNVNPRSTIGTVSDISYYLRALYALYLNEKTGISVDVNYFSPNNPASYCEKCNGLGEEYVVSEEAVIPDKKKKLSNGGILYFKGTKTSMEYRLLEAECDYFGIDIDKSVEELNERELEQLLYRKEDVEFLVRYKAANGRYKSKKLIRKGALAEIENLLKDINTPSTYVSISKYLKKVKCSLCHGNKLNKTVLEISVANKNIADAENTSLDDFLYWLNEVEKESNQLHLKEQIKQLINDMRRRVESFVRLKLEYLTLGRSIPTLSGGEIQRVRLANQLSCPLSGLVYILDEPCKGLHYKNINSIINVSESLVKKGNTVIAIEHNKQYINNADKVIELGPEGGPNGGYIISETEGKKKNHFDIHFKKKKNINMYISFEGISHHNLKGVNVKIPYGAISCITGVSGSGKSSLAAVIAECCAKQKEQNCLRVSNISKWKKVLYVNQQPIGKTPRSTVVSYLGIYDSIRDIFAATQQASELGLVASDFSMNVSGGRCECCQGTGKKKIELSYLPDSYVECPECNGKRFQDDVLSVTYRGVNINQVLDMPIEKVITIFKEQQGISNILQCMIDIGLGYISLGQMSMNLSGGEAQRIKLAKCLGAKSNGKNLYVLDEPTSGLSESDTKLLEDILNKLSTLNETIIIIEHNIEFIAKIADYLIDLGSVAGDKGGNVLIEGNPQDVMGNKKSSWYEYNKEFI